MHRFEEFAAPESATWDRWHDLRNVLRRGLNLSAQLYRALNSPASLAAFSSNGGAFKGGATTKRPHPTLDYARPRPLFFLPVIPFRPSPIFLANAERTFA